MWPFSKATQAKSSSPVARDHQPAVVQRLPDSRTPQQKILDALNKDLTPLWEKISHSFKTVNTSAPSEHSHSRVVDYKSLKAGSDSEYGVQVRSVELLQSEAARHIVFISVEVQVPGNPDDAFDMGYREKAQYPSGKPLQIFNNGFVVDVDLRTSEMKTFYDIIGSENYEGVAHIKVRFYFDEIRGQDFPKRLVISQPRPSTHQVPTISINDAFLEIKTVKANIMASLNDDIEPLYVVLKTFPRFHRITKNILTKGRVLKVAS